MRSIPRVRGVVPTHAGVRGRAYVKELYDPEQWEKLLDCTVAGTPNRDGTIQGLTVSPPPEDVEDEEPISATGPGAYDPKEKFFKKKKKVPRKPTKKTRSGGA